MKRGEIERIAGLARLEIGADEMPVYQRDLGAILGFVEQLAKAETTDIPPMAHPLDVAQRLRPDQVTEADERDRFQAVAPLVEDGFYLVPRVIE